MKRICVVAVVIGLCLMMVPASAVVFVKQCAPGPVFDGTSWDTAFSSIQAGVDAASAGEEVWVAAGTYTETVTLKNGVALYGGFNGTESQRDQRNWKANVTTIDGGQANAVVAVAAGSPAPCRIDGFTICNGDKGTGILFAQSTCGIISNNIIAHTGYQAILATRLSGLIKISNNTIINNSGAGININNGMAVDGTYCLVDISSNTISNNKQYAVKANVCQLSITNNTVTANAGGGINSNGATDITATGNIVKDNSCQVTTAYPGLYCDGKRFISITGNTVSGNTGSNNAGITVVNFSYNNQNFRPAVISNNIVSNNTTDKSDGGGILCPVEATISGNKITGNSAKAVNPGSVYGGGGIYSYAGKITNNIISGNYALYGGGITCGEGVNEVSCNTITGNTSSYAAGMSFVNNCRAVVTNNIVANNTATADGGGIGCGYSSGPILCNNTVVGNTAVNGGGMLLLGTPKVYNNIVAFNTSGMYSPAGASPVLGNNCVYNPDGYNYLGVPLSGAGTGDISADPLFINRLSGDYHLGNGSPCIDGGNASLTGVPTVDFEGQARPEGRSIDIGADESWPLTNIADIKRSGNNARVKLTKAIVSAAFTDFFYVESADRSSGVRVEKVNNRQRTGTHIDVTGVVQTNADGEIYVAAVTLYGQGADKLISPLSMNNKAVGGGKLGNQEGVWGWHCEKDTEGKWQRVPGPETGLNNIGLLVRSWGKLTAIDCETFSIDDGSGCPIECVIPGLTWGYPNAKFVYVTGVASCRKDGDHLVRVIRIVNQKDIGTF